MRGNGTWIAAAMGLLLCGDGRAEERAGEASGPAARLLERYDKNDDGMLEISDLSENLQVRAKRFDANGDGKLDEAELGELAGRMGGGGTGAQRRPGEENTPPAKGERSPDTLGVGDEAPDFVLPLASGEGTIRLSAYLDGKPTVLVFGSLTCPPFRSRMLQFDPIYQKYAGEVNFLMVYTREAHPESTIYVNRDGEEVLETIEQTDDMAQRMDHAQVCGPTLKFTFPTVVDKEDNFVNQAYAGWPSRFVVVGADMRVAFDGGPGPQGFQPAELAAWLAAEVGD
ncbi:MAG: deiodinase-like protein [Verrucomicrobiota bacterium]